MSTETITPEVVAPEEQKELLAVVQQNALPPEAAQSLQSSFAPAFNEVKTILQQSRQIVVTDVGQKLQIKLAREYRLGLKNIRVAADKLRKELKDESVRKGRAIDGFYNILLHLTEAEETRLEEQEKFAEVQEARRKAALKAEREEIAVAIGIDPNLYQLGEMSEETFQTLVEGTKLARAAQEAARVKAEAERIAKEKADAEERERVRLENERLKKEADEREAAAKVERERVAKEKAEAEEALRLERERVEKEKATTAAAAKAELDRREAMAEEERKKAEAEAAEIRRVADQNAAEAKKKADAALKAQQEKARKEREAAEAKAKAEKEAADAENARLLEIERKKAADAAESARKEREAREAAERAEAKRLANEEAAQKKAAAAPDKEKIAALAKSLDVTIPDMATDEGKAFIAQFMVKQHELIAWMRVEYQKL